MKAKEIKRQTIASGKFISLNKVSFIDEKGKEREWETADRVNNTEAVCLFTLLVPSLRYVFIRQYRPAIGKYVIEFPAGLVDKDESYSQAALRELKEETGYSGNIIYQSSPVLSSAGLSSEKVVILRINVDENAPENQNPKRDLDEDENIDVFLIKKNDINEFLTIQQNEGCMLSSRMVSFLLGNGCI